MSYGADWTCKACGWANLDIRKRCRNCGQDNPGSAPTPALVPDPAAGEVVAWAEQYGGKIVSVSLTQGRFHTVPLYPAPAREALAPSEDER